MAYSGALVRIIVAIRLCPLELVFPSLASIRLASKHTQTKVGKGAIRPGRLAPVW